VRETNEARLSLMKWNEEQKKRKWERENRASFDFPYVFLFPTTLFPIKNIEYVGKAKWVKEKVNEVHAFPLITFPLPSFVLC